jgi:hypothetical protein
MYAVRFKTAFGEWIQTQVRGYLRACAFGVRMLAAGAVIYHVRRVG